jgi:hypothetical protein
LARQSSEARLKNLAKAQEVRLWRARLRERIKSGEVDPVQLLLDPPDEMNTMALARFILMVPKLGQWRLTRILNSVHGTRPSVHIGSLSERQRAELAKSLSSMLR